MPVIQLLKEKKIFFIISVVLIAFFVLRIFLLQKPSTDILYTVKKGSLVDTIKVSGTYRTAAQTKVYSPAKGIITQLFVANKDVVAKGEPLFHVESTATDEEKAAAMADYQNAISSLKTAEQNKQAADATMWTKQQAVLDSQDDVNYKNDNSTNPTTGDDYTDLEKQSIESALVQARKDFSAAEKTYKEADIAVAAEQSDLAEAKLAYDATKDITINAPASGTIVNLQKQVGDQVSPKQTATTTSTSSLDSASSSPVIVIADFGNPAILADVNEAYIIRITDGQPAKIVFDALKEQTFDGVVASIDMVGADSNGITSYTARINASYLPKSLRPNMTGLITIETLRKDNVYAVPNSALVTKDGKSYVTKTDSKERNKELVLVTTGVKGIAKTEITSGVSEGDMIVANP